MIKILLLIFISYSSGTNNSFLGQYYSRIRLYEYTDYSDVIFLKFNIDAPTIFANWSAIINRDGKCSNYPANIYFVLQHAAYPLIAPKNESFPDMYITTRHDLFTQIFNQTISNATIELINPLKGSWFVMAFVNLSETNNEKISSNCNISLTTWLDYRREPISLILILNQPFEIILSKNITFIYASYLTSIDNSRIIVQSEWFSNCDINIRVRINGLPNIVQYDYQTICKNGLCSIEIDPLTAFIWIYFQISVDNSSCLDNPIHGSIQIHSTECLSNSIDNDCISIFRTRRIMFDSYYQFTYIPEYSNQSSNTIILNDSSIYSYEFLVDDKNIGGTIHLDFQTQVKSINSNISILVCLSKNQVRRYYTCENDYSFILEQNSSTIRSLPYPEMALWYLTFEHNSPNTSISLTFEISSTTCTREHCGTYGTCRIMISQQNIFSICTCVAGYRGYGCTDSRYNHLWKYLPSALFLTLSNLMFIPAISLAIYYRLYIEALVYFFNMFFSTFYHACDQEIRQFCIFKYDGLQLSDFIGSYSSFVITLITMSMISRSVKVFLFMLGVLTCIALNARDRFNNLQPLILIIIGFIFMVITWIIISIKKRRLQPNYKRLLFILPGILLSITGIILFIFFESDDNYWYTHSLWHIFMATSILFYLPQKIKENQQKQTSTESNTSNGVINEGAIVTENDIVVRPSDN